MIRKAMVGTFIVVILGVIAFSIYDAAQTPATSPLAANPAQVQATTVPVGGQGRVNVTPGANLAGTVEPLQASTDNVGEAWQATGPITLLDDYGMTVATDAGDVYIELGPPDYWQAQNVPLVVGDTVTVDGFNNVGQIHARVVTVGEQQLVVRSETGQPLWSGGANNANAAATGGTPGVNETTFQVAPEDWVTFTGTITATTNGGITVQPAEGDIMTLQLGRPNFWQSQNVTLAAGDAVEIVGFWSGTQFMVGDITKTATGEHIILRDPNGRQLWGGPGRNGTGAAQATQPASGS